jgi:predicted nucleotidyltransferase component of viral defense system
MAKSLLNLHQKLFLDFFCSRHELYKNFYFSGGTALSEYYLKHRYSEDLDFLSEEEVNSADLNLFLTTNKKEFKAKKIQFTQSFNRNIFFLYYEKAQELKVEFTYYPFTRLDKTHNTGNLQIDSALDIAVNKAFILTQQARGRDYFDLYMLCQKYDFVFMDLLKKARQKFDYPINYLELGKNLLKVCSFLDDPILIKEIDRGAIEDFFLNIADKLELLD